MIWRSGKAGLVILPEPVLHHSISSLPSWVCHRSSSAKCSSEVARGKASWRGELRSCHRVAGTAEVMADPPRLPPPPGRHSAASAAGGGGDIVSPDDVKLQLQMMGISEGDAQKPLSRDLVWGPEPDDLDAELALVEKELAQLNAMELAYNQSADVHVGSDPVWAMQQSFEAFPEYATSDGGAPANYAALASNTAALTMQSSPPNPTGGQASGQGGAWLEFESPFAASGPTPSVAPFPPQAAQQPAPPTKAAAAPPPTTGPIPKEATHKAVFRFIPRHADELEMNTGDPIVVHSEAPDLWFSGQNLRSGQSGIFPGHCVANLKAGVAGAMARAGTKKPARFRVRFLGAVQVSHHKGVDLLGAAMKKVMEWRKKNEVGPLKPVILEISVEGLKMKDISAEDEKYQEEKRQSIRKAKNFEVDRDGGLKKFFFPLVNVTFCSCHPKNNRLWAFVARRKDKTYTCQVFAASQSTQPLTVAMGRAFKQLHTSFLNHAFPSQDFYQE